MSARAWMTCVVITALSLVILTVREGRAYAAHSLGQRLTVACPSEDGGPVIPCRWDARTMGNRTGTEVYLVTDDGNGVRHLHP